MSKELSQPSVSVASLKVIECERLQLKATVDLSSGEMFIDWNEVEVADGLTLIDISDILEVFLKAETFLNEKETSE